MLPADWTTPLSPGTVSLHGKYSFQVLCGGKETLNTGPRSAAVTKPIWEYIPLNSLCPLWLPFLCFWCVCVVFVCVHVYLHVCSHAHES